MRKFAACLLAHLHCLFDWELQVCHGPDWIGCCKKNDPLPSVITYPIWVILRKAA